jgi:hypothetical protein
MREVSDFDSAEELRNYTIGIIRQIGLCSSLAKQNPMAFHYFKDLFLRHPEKERKGVLTLVDISIRRFPKTNPRKNPLEVSDYQFVVHQADGTEDTISWNTCAKGEVNPVGKKINWAMRLAIEGQIREFKATQKGKPCELCGSHEKPTADHIKKFKDLKDEFLAAHPDHPTEFAKNQFAQEIFRAEDAEFERQWLEFHRANATLRILCEACNRKLDNYGSWWV